MFSYKSTALTAAIILGHVAVSHAIPTLQLDISGGVYNTTDQTTYATSSHFDLVALLNCKTLDPSRTYYVSAAIEPRLDFSTPPPNVGSFVVNGTSFAPDNMYWGKPPANILDTVQGNLAMHDEYPTYYAEFAFHFDAAHTVAAYNTQTGDASPGSLYAYTFSIDTSPLLPGYSVHFDLYDEAVSRRKGDFTLDDFAPFSHDAQSTTNRVPVPDGASTCLLLGVGILGVTMMYRRRTTKLS